MKRIVNVIFLFSLLGSLSAQEYVFEKITTQQGLSQNDVNCVFQDHKGFLWIGTNDGLNRYDGYTFRTFRIDQENKEGKGLSSNLIYKVKEDNDGRLWIATSNEGVCVFDAEKESFTQIRNTSKNPVRLASNRIFDVECMSDSTIWVATDKGVTVISEANGYYETINLITIANAPLVSKGCNTIAEDAQGRKWLGFYKGLVVCEQKDGEMQTTPIKGFENENIRSILPVTNGIIVGTASGLFLYQEKPLKVNQAKLTRLSYVDSKDIYIDQAKDLYVATQKGVMIYSCDFLNQRFEMKAQVRGEMALTKLNSDMVTSLCGDSSGIIWIGTIGGGLNKYNPKRKKFSHYKSTGLPGSLSNNKITTILEDSKHNIWIGTEGGGMNYLDNSTNRNFSSGFKNYLIETYQMENKFYSLLEVEQENGSSDIWAGAGHPLKLVRFRSDENGPHVHDQSWISEITDSAPRMLRDIEGNIWLGTYGSTGLYKCELDGDSYTLTNYRAKGEKGNLSSNIIRSLLQDKQGNIWIGTDTGLNLLTVNELTKDIPSFKVFKNSPDNENSLSNDYVLPLFQSTTGNLWVGTMGGGLNKINFDKNFETFSFTSYDTSDGFPNNVIKGILEDDNGNLWISSNKGLTRFNPKTMNILNYDISDGLQDYEFGEMACCKLSDGMMIFGGVNGFNTFYPDQINEDKIPPKVVFTDLQVLNKSVEVGEEVNNRVLLDKVLDQSNRIELKHSENSFAIYFSAMHFSAPIKNKYKYMLEGFDQNWIVKKSNERFAKYTSLNPGKYVFKLYASNNDGVWSAEPREIEVVVIPPWWQSTVAIVIYSLLFIALLWFFQRYSIIRIKQKNELLMEHFEKEKLEELSQMKFRFFTNVSHEFRTPLTLIIGSVQKLIGNKTELPEDVKEKHATIERNSSIMLRLINQLMDFRKMEQDKMALSVSQVDIVQILKDNHASFEEMMSNKNIQFTFSRGLEELIVWIDVDKIEKIVYNLLSNAFKFTNKGGQIDLTLLVQQEDVVIQVKDNGMGIPKDIQTHIFERFYQGSKLKQPNYNGTGIGLSYSKGLAELHSGDIRFDSEEGNGSCFELHLQRGKAHYGTSDFYKTPSVKPQSLGLFYPEVETVFRDVKEYAKTSGLVTHKHTMLIVEDNLDLLEFLADSFTEHYNVYRAENGVEGLGMVETYDIDIIISDIAMPLKDGFELCHEIKMNEKISHIPVILLTAKIAPKDSIKGYQIGADAYVSKPFDINVLESHIAGVLKNRETLKQKFKKSIEIIPSEVTSTSADERFLNQLLTIVEDNISKDEFTVVQLSEAYGMNQVHINKKLKSLTGYTANAFIRSVRLKRACQLLKTGRYSVAEVTYEVGFSDLKYFRSCFKKEFKINPSEYVKQESGI